MKKKHLIILTAIMLLSSLSFAAQPSEEAQKISLPDTTTLLLSYVENDPELRNLTISAKKASLSYESTKIDSGFDVTLSSGTITLQVNEDGSKLSARPSVKAKLPQASNLSLTGQTVTENGLVYWELSPGQTLGIYTASGWQFWINGSKRGWFDSRDSQLHVSELSAESGIRLGADWLMSAAGGFGLRYIGG